MRHFQRRRLNMFVLVLLVNMLVAPKSEAEEIVSPKLTLAPHTFELEGYPGEVIQRQLKVFNHSSVAIPINLRTTDFTAAPDSGQMIPDLIADDPSWASSRWFNFSTQHLILEPGESESITFTLQIPDNAEAGGHYSLAILEPQIPPQYFEANQPRVIPVLSAMFMISVLGADNSRQAQPISVDSFLIPERYHLWAIEPMINWIRSGLSSDSRRITIVNSLDVPYELNIKNKDIYHVKLTGSIILDDEGRRIQINTPTVPDTTVLPGKTRQLKLAVGNVDQLSWTNKLGLIYENFLTQSLISGSKEAQLRLLVQPNADEVRASLVIWVFPWKTNLIGLFLLTCLVMIRKRVWLAFGAWVKKDYR